ncbi:MAG: FkbM family methyltransferase [Pseudomonadota bacterium]
MASTRRQYRTLEEFCHYLHARGYTPGTVIDVGAAFGTPELLQSFPDAYHILIDPVPSYEDRFREILNRYRGEYHLIAVGDVESVMPLRVPAGQTVGSSLLTEGEEGDLMVPVVRLDTLFDDRSLEPPILLKTDCQGYDMKVTAGGRRLLAKCDLVVCEVNLFHPTGRPDLPDLGDTVQIMRDLGFAVYDIVSYQTRPYDDALGYVDLVFANEQSEFRKVHRWQ